MDEKFPISGTKGDQEKGIKCPHCKVVASQVINMLSIALSPEEEISSDNKVFGYHHYVVSATCKSCSYSSIWLKKHLFMTRTLLEGNLDIPKVIESTEYENLIYPLSVDGVEDPNPDMPIKVKDIYNEAISVLNNSPRASAALSRLAIQALVDELITEKSDLNTKIGKLVANGLPVQVQQMLDSVRVIGNNAVHPGQIDFKDNHELALTLLSFINLIVDNQISQPKRIESIYSSLPEGALKGIQNRDQK